MAEDLERKPEKTVFNMKLHEHLTIDGFYVLRVHQGWIYYGWDDDKDKLIDGTFVPYKEPVR